MSTDRDRFYGKLLVAQRLLPEADVRSALERVAEARSSGNPGGSLVETLLREGAISADDALALRAEYDRRRKKRRSRKTAAASASHAGRAGTDAAGGGGTPATADDVASDGGSSGSGTGSATNHSQSATGAAHSSRPGRVSGISPSSASAQVMATFSDRPEDPDAAARKVPPDPLIGRVVGGCRVESKLGEGGMGTVYRAAHIGLDKPVALKVLPPNLTDCELRVQRFRREARSAAQIEHPNIVQILNVGSEDGVHYIIMQYIQGEDLRHRLRREGPLPARQILEVASQVARGLSAAHKRGIVHRDIKPDNIMFDEDERVKLTDFGLAKSRDTDTTTTRPGKAVGTPYYMSPEQCAGKDCDARSDIYSLGATLYHVATGRRPFKGDTPVQTALMHLRQPLVPPVELKTDLPQPVNDMIARMMEKNPDDRFQSCEELLAAVDAVEMTLDAASPLEMINQLVGGRAAGEPPTLGESGVAEDATEPSLPAVGEGSASGTSTVPDSGTGDGGDLTRDDLAHSGDQSRSLTGRVVAAVTAQRGLAIGTGVGLLLLLIVLALALGGGDPGPTPPGPNHSHLPPDNGRNPENSPPGDNSGTPDPIAARHANARRHFRTVTRPAVAQSVGQGQFDHAIDPLNDFLDLYANTPVADEARQLMAEVRRGAENRCATLLGEVVARADEDAQAGRVAEALAHLEQGDAVILNRLIDKFDFDGIRRHLESQRSAYRDEASRATDQALGRAQYLLREERFFEAERLLQQAMAVGVPDQVARLQAAISEITDRIDDIRTHARVAVQGWIEQQQTLLETLLPVLQRIDRLAATPAGTDEARQLLRREWLDVDTRRPLRPLIAALLAELDELAEVHEAVVTVLQRSRGTIELQWSDSRTPTDMRLLSVDPADGLRVSVDGDTREVAWTGFHPASLLALVPDRVLDRQPQAHALYLLAHMVDTPVARRELLALSDAHLALQNRLPRVGALRSLTAIHGALVPGFNALAIAWQARGGSMGMDTISRVRSLVGVARDTDPLCGPAGLARALLERNDVAGALAPLGQIHASGGWYTADPLFAANWALRLVAVAESGDVSQLGEPWTSMDLSDPELRSEACDAVIAAANQMLGERLPDTAFWQFVESRMLFVRARAGICNKPPDSTYQLEASDLQQALRLDPAAREIWELLDRVDH